MTCTSHVTLRTLRWATVALLCCASSSAAQDGSPPPTDTPAATEASSPRAESAPRPSLLQPFAEVWRDVRALPTRQNAGWLTIGLGSVAATWQADRQVSRSFSALDSGWFEPGAVVGGTPLQLGGAFATYAVGRATNSPRAMRLGSDLIRAQVLAELVTTGIKQSTRRARPDGGGFSFSSGHTAVSFASATILHDHFGWKAGLPAYAVASYVAASRVQMKRHYLSDIAFGAALGIVAGRTVILGRDRTVTLAPLLAPGGAGVSITWKGKP